MFWAPSVEKVTQTRVGWQGSGVALMELQPVPSTVRWKSWITKASPWGLGMVQGVKCLLYKCEESLGLYTAWYGGVYLSPQCCGDREANSWSLLVV